MEVDISLAMGAVISTKMEREGVICELVYGNYKPTIKDKDGKDVVITYEKFDENHKKMISKNDEAKMVLYNALPKKEYERIFMCDMAKDIWNSLIITHQALDESFSSRNHVRKFLRALPTKWRPKVTAIEESKDLSTLPLDELIGNLKVYEVVLEKDLETSRNKKEKYKSLALKARKVLSEEEVTSSDSNDEEYAMTVRDFKKFFRRRGKFVRQPHDDKRNFRKAKEDKKEKDDRRCFNEDDSKKEEICLTALDDNEVRLKDKLEPDEWIKDSSCLRHMTGNKDLFSSYKTIDGDLPPITSNPPPPRPSLNSIERMANWYGYSLKDKNEAKTDKTEHGFEKSVKNRGQRVKIGSWFPLTAKTQQAQEALLIKRKEDRDEDLSSM
ncbi:hypothetical protein Tco_1136573 [Tanacetum coccineum]